MTAKYIHELIEKNEYLPVYFLPVHCKTVTTPAHWHEHLELVYFLSGKMTSVIQGHTYKLVPGTLMIINSKEIHMTQTFGDNRYLLLQIPLPEVQRFIPSFDQLKFQTLISLTDNLEVNEQITSHLNQMFELHQEKKDGYPLLFTSHLYMLLYHLYKHYSFQEQSDHKHNQAKDFHRIVQTMRWVNEHFCDPITLTDAAANLNISKEYFCRLFKKYTGQTFLEYVYAVRTTNLYEDLKKTDTNLTLLLEKNGITNYKIFMRTFKKLYGDTPRNTRKNLLNSGDGSSPSTFIIPNA